MTHDPFKIDGPTCISFSGGRTSAYMLWRVLQSNGGLPKDAVVCFANTGKEDENTLKFIKDCESNWKIKIVWLEYTKDKPHFKTTNFEQASRNGEPFEALIQKKNYLPNPIARFCTEELKVRCINRYLADAKIDADKMIGVRADEPRRVGKLRQRGMLLPLVDAGITQRDIQVFWQSNTFDLQLQFINGITALGNCDLCFLKGGYHIASMIADKPERAVWWANMEEKIGATWRSDRESYGSMLKFAHEQRDMFDPQEETIACFCGD